MSKARKLGVNLMIPVDNVVANRFSNDADTNIVSSGDIPDGWMAFGSPAKPIRPLRDDELASLVDAAEEYREIGRDMESQGLLLPGSEYSPI